MNPKVSIVAQNYNHENYLEERISSITAQSEEAIEIILLDDASSDNSQRILKEHATRPSIKLDINLKNSGSTFHQWNKGGSLATAEYVWIAESDDIAEPDFLKTMLELFATHPNAVLAYAQSEKIDGNGCSLGLMSRHMDEMCFHHLNQDFHYSGREFCASYLVRGNVIPNASAVLFKRAAYLAGGADASMRLCGDWLMWSKILKHGISFSPKRF